MMMGMGIWMRMWSRRIGGGRVDSIFEGMLIVMSTNYHHIFPVPALRT
jgi:hypothetical protein